MVQDRAQANVQLRVMAAWSLGAHLQRGRQDRLWQQLSWTPIGGVRGVPRTGATCLTSKCAQLANNRSCRLSNLVQVGRPQIGGCGLTSRGMFSDNSELRRHAGCERVATAENVSELCQQGWPSKAVEALGILVQTDSQASCSLFYTVLKKCVAKKDLVLGRRVHALAVESGYESDTFLCNHILRMYASHGRLQEAMDVFTMVSKPDAFTWSSVLSAQVKYGQAKEAIHLYHQMRWSTVKPDSHVFVAALQACARGADLKAGQQVHMDVLASGGEPNLFVSSCLVDMYAKCGSMRDAHRIFDGLREKDVVTWTALITGYSQQGMGQEALHLYSAMQEEGIGAPDSVIFSSLLQACASVGAPALGTGKDLHVQIRKQGFQADGVVGCSLVNMYAKCGSLEDAQGVFDGLSQKDVVTWNAMIAGYSQQGMGEQAFQLHRAMRKEGFASSDIVTFVCLLQACTSMGVSAVNKGKQLHAEIEEQGLGANAFVANSLVNMYVKCGSLEDAESLFNKLGAKTVVTWNALIAGYSQLGMGQKALHLYSLMQEEGTTAPDSVTFVCLLHACTGEGTSGLEKGKRLHAQIEQHGLQGDLFIADSLINMYAKCGSLEDAEIVFDGLHQKTVVTWNAMIAGYSQQGMGQEALRLYTVMQQEGIAPPDAVTFACLLQACASVGTTALEKGKHLHSQIQERGLQADVYVANSLLNMYAKCGSLHDAQTVFDGLNQKTVVSWNAMITGYTQQGLVEEALDLYRAMQEGGTHAPNVVTYVAILQACASMGTPALEKGKHVHTQIEEQGLQADVFVANSLVSMYARCGSIEDAQTVFDELAQKDVVTWNAMIAGYSQQGKGLEALHVYTSMREEGMVPPDSVTFSSLLQACATVGAPALEKGKQLHVEIGEHGLQADVFVANSLVNMYAKCGSLPHAQSVFDELDKKNVVTWNAMIAGYSQQGKGHHALHLYAAMQAEGTAVPDSVTFSCLLQVCADMAAWHAGKQLHSEIEKQGRQTDVFVAVSLINMYAKSGSMVDAQQVFDGLPERDIVAWNALIAGYTRQGDSKQVFTSVQQMGEDGINPDGITFLSLLTVCSHAGLVRRGREYFEAMSRQFSITPTAEHYTCMVDLLGRACQLEEALMVVRTMPVVPPASAWHSLLAACQKWSNVEVGVAAFLEAVKLDEKDAAAYVLMANIYTGAHMWKEAQEVQAKRLGIGAWKQPGQSWWTDMDGLVRSFVVGDIKHAEPSVSVVTML